MGGKAKLLVFFNHHHHHYFICGLGFFLWRKEEETKNRS